MLFENVMPKFRWSQVDVVFCPRWGKIREAASNSVFNVGVNLNTFCPNLNKKTKWMRQTTEINFF